MGASSDACLAVQTTRFWLGIAWKALAWTASERRMAKPPKCLGGGLEESAKRGLI